MTHYDYFRAADDQAVMERMEAVGHPFSDEAPRMDVVESKVDPQVVFGKLVAFALDVPWELELVTCRLIWSDPEDVDHEGPWVYRLDPRARDALAGVSDDQVPGLARRWSEIEELARWAGGSDVRLEDEIRPLLTDLVGLCRRARSAGHHLYCWTCL